MPCSVTGSTQDFDSCSSGSNPDGVANLRYNMKKKFQRKHIQRLHMLGVWDKYDYSYYLLMQSIINENNKEDVKLFIDSWNFCVIGICNKEYISELNFLRKYTPQKEIVRIANNSLFCPYSKEHFFDIISHLSYLIKTNPNNIKEREQFFLMLGVYLTTEEINTIEKILETKYIF